MIAIGKEAFSKRIEEETDDKNTVLEYRAVWIRYMYHEKRRFKKTGVLQNVNLEKNGENQLYRTHKKRRSAENDWKRKKLDTRNNEEIKEMYWTPA